MSKENMSVLELMKEAVRILEEKEVAEKVCKLSELQPGDIFKADIYRFIVREQIGGTTGVMMIGCWSGEDRAFHEDGCPDYKRSGIKEHYDGEILKALESVFGAENIIEDEVDLTTMDGQKDFGTVRCKVHPPTFDEWRQCSPFFKKGDFESWFWTCTPWSTPDRGFDYSVAVVYTGGALNYCSAHNAYAEAVACILSSAIMVEKE